MTRGDRRGRKGTQESEIDTSQRSDARFPHGFLPGELLFLEKGFIHGVKCFTNDAGVHPFQHEINLP